MDDVIRKLAAKIEADLTASLFGSTTSNAEPLPPLRAEDLLRSMRKIQMAERQTRVTFVVDLAHDGPMLGYRTAAEGQVFELSWLQAQHVHQHWPLKMSKVRSPECAEFVPATMFDTFIPKVLDMPPFDMPSEQEEDPASVTPPDAG